MRKRFAYGPLAAGAVWAKCRKKDKPIKKQFAGIKAFIKPVSANKKAGTN